MPAATPRRLRAAGTLAPALLLALVHCGAPSAPDASRGDAAAPDGTPPPADVADRDATGLDAPAADTALDASRDDATTLPDAAAEASAPAVRLIGRIDRGDPAGPRFEWSGSAIVARFDGTAVTVRLRDSGNYFHVAIDGAERPLLIGSAGTTSYPLATGLPAGPHTVELWRRTEAFGNPTQFLGFDFGAGGALLPPPPAATRRIELIGDSISCGYGDEGTSATCHFSLATENHYLSYGALAARALDAELITVAWSGYGMYRGYGGSMTDTIPTIYDRALPTIAGNTWDFAQWTPDAVVINLGTNDWAMGDPGQAYTDAYVAFVRRLRTHYPRAYVLASIGPTHAPGPRIQAALTTLRAGGDTRLGYLEYTIPANEWGCDYHPNLVAQAAMGDQLTAALRMALGW